MSRPATAASSLFLSALIAVATVMVPGAARAADTLIQPGAEVNSSVGQCTLNYVFRDGGGTLFIATGDELVEPGLTLGAGQIRNSNAPMLLAQTARAGGRPHYLGIARDRLDSLTPLIHEGLQADVLLLSGYGVVFSTLAQTRGRPGILADDTPTLYLAELPSIFGDSGGPVIESATGKALGIVSGIGLTIPPSTLLGPTVEGTLRTLASHGFALLLVTAPYHPALPR